MRFGPFSFLKRVTRVLPTSFYPSNTNEALQLQCFVAFSFIGSADICKTYLRPSGTASGCTRRFYTASEKAAIRFRDAGG